MVACRGEGFTNCGGRGSYWSMFWLQYMDCRDCAARVTLEQRATAAGLYSLSVDEGGRCVVRDVDRSAVVGGSTWLEALGAWVEAGFDE